MVQNESQVSFFQLFFAPIFRSWDFHVHYSVWDAKLLQLNILTAYSFENWIEYFIEKFCEYYCLNIVVNFTFVSTLNTNMNTTLKYYRKQALKKKLKLIRGAMKFFTKKLLGREIFNSMITWAINFFLKIF